MSDFSKKVSLPWLILILVIAVALAALIYYSPKKEVKNYTIIIDGSSDNNIEFQYGVWPQLGDVDFFNNVLEKFIEQKMDFITADLDQMKLRVFKQGEIIKEVPIGAKGREGSWWETPVGLYKIEAKHKKAYSNFAGVYIPYSLVFDGTFLIHGWPYYPSGKPVSSTYSDGCIRLFDEDAKEIYNLAEVGMPVLVFKKAFEVENSTYQYKIPELSAQAYLAADLKNNFIFLEKSRNQILPIASITKLITSLVVLDYTNLEHYARVPQEAIIFTSIPRLKAGQKIPIYELLALLLAESSNEAGNTLAAFLGSEKTINLMNNQAKSIGMTNSHFVDPNGVRLENVSTPLDLYQLAKYLYFNRSFILKMTKGIFDNDYYGQPSYDLKNLNLFADDPSFVGGKMGLTSGSGETMLAIFELSIGDSQKRPVVFVVLNSKDVYTDIVKMVEFVKNHYQFENE